MCQVSIYIFLSADWVRSASKAWIMERCKCARHIAKMEKRKKKNHYNLQDISSSGIEGTSVSCLFLLYFLFMEKVQSSPAHREPLKNII